MFWIETLILDYWEKTRTENQQLFDGVEVLDYCLKEGLNSNLEFKSFVFITEIIWRTFDVIIDDPYLTE